MGRGLLRLLMRESGVGKTGGGRGGDLDRASTPEAEATGSPTLDPTALNVHCYLRKMKSSFFKAKERTVNVEFGGNHIYTYI